MQEEAFLFSDKYGGALEAYTSFDGEALTIYGDVWLTVKQVRDMAAILTAWADHAEARREAFNTAVRLKAPF